MRHTSVLSLLGFLLVILLFGPGVGPARAADFRSGQTVVIAADETIDDDLFVAAETIEINGTITGDLIATGRLIILHGTVEGSAALAGQSIDVFGSINGSLYSAGYALTLNEGSTVGRNVYFRGYSLITQPDSSIGRDLYAAVAQVSHGGVIEGDLNARVNALEIDGQVEGDVTGDVAAGNTTNWMNFVPPALLAQADSQWLRTASRYMPEPIETITPGLQVGSNAEIGGEMLASQPEAGSLRVPDWLAERVGMFLGLLLIAALVIYFRPNFLPAIGDVLQHKLGFSLGWGALIYLLLFPLALIAGLILVFLLTILFALASLGQLSSLVFGLTGSFLLFALFAFLFVVYVFTWIIVGHRLGRRLLARDGIFAINRWGQFRYVALGLLILEVLRAIPILGFILAFLVGAIGLGVLFLYRKARREGKIMTPLAKPAAGS